MRLLFLLLSCGFAFAGEVAMPPALTALIAAERVRVQARLAQAAEPADITAALKPVQAAKGMNPTGRIFRAWEVDNVLAGTVDGDPAAPIDAGDHAANNALNAIVRFHRQLAARGTHLIVVPVPTSVMVYGSDLLPEGRRDRWVYPAYDRVLDRLLGEGVDVVDLLPEYRTLARTAGSEGPVHRADHHWAPDGIVVAAARTVERLRALGGIAPELDPKRFASATAREKQSTFMFRMNGMRRAKLDMAPDFAYEAITYDGKPLTTDPASPVLCLGDSMLMHLNSRGQGGGFVDHLARALQRRVGLDQRQGATKTMPNVYAQKHAARTPPPQAVVWIIYGAAFGPRYYGMDWAMDRLPEPGAAPAAAAAGAVTVEARLKTASRPPDPKKDDYEEANTAGLWDVVRVVSGTLTAKQVKIVLPAMAERKPTANAAIKAGSVRRFTLIPWNAATAADPDLAQTVLIDDIGGAEPLWWCSE
jgi:hypothetical protein